MCKKTKLRAILMAFVVGLLPLQLAAQTLNISGAVTDANSEPVVGASVVVKGTTTGVITDAGGGYNISAPADAVLLFSMVGMGSREEAVGGRARIDVQLAEAAKNIDDVVVVGYGTVKKSDLTGAVAAVSAKELTIRPVSNALEALQGKAAGVEITSNQRPGELGSVRVRGMRSLTATNDPLYVVDGVVLSAGGIESLNPRDIESISVLKDASSTAIYGSRGANGVILVTTKKGRDGAFKLSYSGTMTIEKLQDLQPSMSAADYITWLRWAQYNKNPISSSNPGGFAPGNQPTYANDMLILANTSFPDPVKANVLKGWEGGTWDASKVTNTDWADMVTQTGVTQEHTISASGGTDRIKSYVSFGYLNNKGTTKGQEYERYNFNTSTDVTATKWFTMGGSINAAWSIQDYGFNRENLGNSSRPNELYTNAKRIPNIALPYDDEGNVVQIPASYNIYSIVDEWKASTSIDQRQTLRALGNFYANLNFGEMWEPLKGLNYRISFGPDMRFNRRGRYFDKTSPANTDNKNKASWNYDRNFSWVLNNIVSYSKEMNIHKFDVTLIQEASKYDNENASMGGSGLEKSSYLWNVMGSLPVTETASGVSISTGITQSQIASYGFRGNYTLMDKYLLTVSGRYDGSSVLAEGNKWAFFPSAAVAWRIEQEEFMKSFDWLSQMKLRAGIGQTGNAAVSPYQTLGRIMQFYTPFGGKENNALVFVPNEPYFYTRVNPMANPDLGWEKTTQWNIGLDFSVLKGRVGGSIDIYASNTNDLIMNMSIPTITGYSSTTANVGKTKNKGVDISLNAIPVETHGFVWNSTINTAWHKDEIVELAYGKQDMVSSNWFIGQPISVFYGYQNNGLWKESDADEMAKFNAKGAKFKPGMVRPVDQNGDSTMNADDRVVLGNRIPKWTFGWSNTFSYKGIELGVELYGRFGYMVTTGGQWQAGVNQNQIDYWTPDNTGAKWQMPIWGDGNTAGDDHSGLLGNEKAAYLKVRSISLGYYLPSKLCHAAGIGSLKVYGQIRNVGNIFSTIDYLDLDYNDTNYNEVYNTNNVVSYYNRGFILGLELTF